MAESGGNFDFTVSVPVVADLAGFRRDVKAAFDEVQKGVVAPVGSGGGSVASGAATGGLPSTIGAGAPPSTAIATAAQNAVNQALAPTAATAQTFGPGHALVQAIRNNEAHVGGQLFAMAGGQRLQLQSSGFGRVTPDFNEAVLANGGTLALSAIQSIQGAGGNVFWQRGGGATGAATAVAVQQAMTKAATAQLTPPGVATAMAAAQAGGGESINIPNASAGSGGDAGGGSFPVSLSPMLGTGGGRGGLGGALGGRGVGAGMGGLLTVGFALHAAGRLAMAKMEHDRAIRQADGDPVAMIRADIQYQDRAGRAIPVAGEMGLAIREAVTGDQEYIENTLLSAERRDRVTGMQRERMFTQRDYAAGRGFSQALEQTRISYDRTMSELRERQARISSEIRQMYPGQPGVDEKLAEVTELGRQMDVAGQTQKRAQAELMGNQTLAVAEMRSRTIGYLQQARGATSPAAMERSALVRQQAIDFARMGQEDPSRLTDLAQNQGAERAAFDAQTLRANQLANIQSSTIVQSAALRAANRPYEAGLEELRGRGNAAAFQARNDPAAYQRALQESNARRQEYTTSFAREQAQGLNQAADSQLVTQKLIDRDVLGARIAGIAAQRNTALDVTDALPPGVRERVQGAITRGADLQANLARRQEADTLRAVGMNVEGRRRVTGIIADDSRPWGERVAAAQAEGIADDAMQRSEVWRQRGVGYEKFRQDELDIGRNELRAARQAFVRSFQPVEIESLSRVALSGTDIDRNLREYRAQEDRLKQGGDRGGAFGPPPADSNQGVGAENARKTDRTNELLDLILKALENGATAVAGP